MRYVDFMVTKVGEALYVVKLLIGSRCSREMNSALSTIYTTTRCAIYSGRRQVFSSSHESAFNDTV